MSFTPILSVSDADVDIEAVSCEVHTANVISCWLAALMRRFRGPRSYRV